MPWRFGLLLAVTSVTVLAAACTTREPSDDTYFDRTIAPTLTTGCARSPTGGGCHVADFKGNALGNLDVSTYENVAKRRDLLAGYGPYEQPGLLVKVIPNFELELRAYDGKTTKITTDIRHAGGSVLDPSGSAYRVLRRWIDAGATKNNAGAPPSVYASLPCGERPPPAAGRDLAVDPPTPDFRKFKDQIHPMLVERCGSGNCHGGNTNELQLACGSAPEDIRANYWASVDYLGQTPEQSELLRRPLAPASGGAYHGGGPIFQTPSDSGYVSLTEWANEHGPLKVPELSPGFDFFVHRVQPVLVRKGCMQLQCHSASVFHDYRLRGGASGSFSLTSSRKNYQLTLDQLALETDDVTASRLVRKNLYRPELGPGAVGIVHRGGPLFEDLGAPANGASCDGQTYDYDNGNLDQIPALCVIREWLRRERAARPVAPLSGVVYVSRDLPGGVGGLLDFDAYAPGSDLRIADVSGAGASLTASNDRSVMAGCGLTPAAADVKRPQVSWDGTKIAFAARTAAGEPLRLYEMNADGTGCAPITEIGAHPTTSNGMLVHDFDPAYSPPLEGGGNALVFASTRGNLATEPYDYSGTQRTPADPSRPNANLYVWEPDPHQAGKRRIRQLTFLLNTERAPGFMDDGRVVFTVDKRLPGFSQIGLRRINLDGGDYHPLYGQRGSLGYREISQVVHLADKNFAAIFADRGVPHRGGALGIFNRSMGVDLYSADPKDYPLDPSVLDPGAVTSPDPGFFIHSLRLPDPSATGRVAGATSGVFASPARMPDGAILVSFGAASSSAAFGGDYDVHVLDSSTGQHTRLVGTPGKADVEAAPIYGRQPRTIYKSKAGEPNAFSMDESRQTADILLHDTPLIFSLVAQNTPTGRVIDDGLKMFDIWEDLPPTPEVTRMDQGGAFVAKDDFGEVYVRRRLLGSVPVESDGSSRFAVTGGLPLVITLAETPLSRERSLPRVVPEHFGFHAGESTHEGFPRAAYNGFCAGCHGSISGKPLDFAMQPDIMSRASDTISFRKPPMALTAPPSGRGEIVGPTK